MQSVHIDNLVTLKNDAVRREYSLTVYIGPPQCDKSTRPPKPRFHSYIGARELDSLLILRHLSYSISY